MLKANPMFFLHTTLSQCQTLLNHFKSEIRVQAAHNLGSTSFYSKLIDFNPIYFIDISQAYARITLYKEKILNASLRYHSA